MDERQSRVEVGAGLQESRLNTEFIDFLKRWTAPVLWVIVLVVGVIAGLNWLETRRLAEIDAALSQYEAERDGLVVPATMIAVAEDNAGVSSVYTLAKKAAGDAMLGGAAYALEPGELNEREQPVVIEDDRRRELAQRALEQFEDAARENRGSRDRAVYEFNALWGVASAHLSLAELSEDEGERSEHESAAVAALERLAARAEATGDPFYAGAARNRIAYIEEIGGPVRIVSGSELPIDEGPVGPSMPQMPGGGVGGMTAPNMPPNVLNAPGAGGEEGAGEISQERLQELIRQAEQQAGQQGGGDGDGGGEGGGGPDGP